VAVVRQLYARFRQIIHEFAKFGVIGVIGVIITNVGYDLLHSHGIGPVTATTIATIVATAVAYVGNRYWSFAHRERTSVSREGIIFFVLNGIGLLVQDAAVAFNSYALHLEHHKTAEFLALNIGIAIATIFRFWSYRKFVWPRLNPADEAGSAAVPGPAAPSGQPSAAGPAGTVQPEAERLSPAEARPAAPHANGDTPGRAARPGSFSRS
jgi:putative flippase GtrA